MADSSLAGASTGAATGQTVPPPHPPTATSAGAQQQRSSSGTPQPDDSSSAAPIAAGAGATRSFAAPQQTTHERLSTQTVGLVALSDFRKRRAEVLEQQEREARERALAQQRQSRLQGQQGGVGGGSGSGGSGSGTPVERGSRTGTPSAAASGGEGATDGSGKEGGDAALKRKKAKLAAKKGRSGGPVKLSFEGDDEDDEGAGGSSAAVVKKVKTQNGDSLSESRPDKPADADSHEVAAGTGSGTGTPKKPSGGAKLAPNTALAVLPRPLTKAAMARDAAERDALRRRFLATQERVRATEIAVPFVFYDGSSIPGGTVRMKKGDFVWVFLDRSRKMGARKAAAGSKTGAVADAETKAGLSRKEWARVGVDDLMLVRGSVIIPHVSILHFGL